MTPIKSLEFYIKLAHKNYQRGQMQTAYEYMRTAISISQENNLSYQAQEIIDRVKGEQSNVIQHSM